LISTGQTALHALFGTLLTLAVLWLPISIIVKSLTLLKADKQPLEEVMQTLKETQAQLISQEKMASIGLLTAGIAHEIKNPLNFINNFSEITIELLEELKRECLKSTSLDQQAIIALLEDIMTNCKKIHEHGKRAEFTVKNMLIQTSASYVEKIPTDINALLEEYINLAYHGMRAQNSNFHTKITKNFDKSLPPITISPQNIGRVFLNIVNNALYAINEKSISTQGYEPNVVITTEQNTQFVVIKVKDNGKGIPLNLRSRIFEPFFTTKPQGVGTGLGLHICYDIVVKEHHGKLEVLSTEGEFTEFIIKLPKETNN